MSSEHPLALVLLNEFLESVGQPALGEDEDGSCYICSETYLSGDSPEFPVALKCGHKAGSKCVMKWLSPLRNSGYNSCPQCRATVFEEWNKRDFPPPSPVVPLGNGPAERAEQIEIASTALGNVFAMLPEGGSAELDVRRVGRLTLRAVRAPTRPAEVEQTIEATMDGREPAASAALPGEAARIMNRPRPAGHRDGASGRGPRREWLDHVDRAETRNPATYRPYRPEYGHRQTVEATRRRSPTESPSHNRQPETHSNNTRRDRAETVATPGFPRPLDGAISDEGVSPAPEQMHRRAPRTTTQRRASPDSHSSATTSASSSVRPMRSPTITAASSGNSVDSLATFDTYRSYWAAEGNGEGRRDERRGRRPPEI